MTGAVNSMTGGSQGGFNPMMPTNFGGNPMGYNQFGTNANAFGTNANAFGTNNMMNP